MSDGNILYSHIFKCMIDLNTYIVGARYFKAFKKWPRKRKQKKGLA